MRTFRAQIHNYDVFGIYHIVDEPMITVKDAVDLRKQAAQSVEKDPFSKLPDWITHILYYADMRDENDEITFAGVYMHGEALDDRGFERICRNCKSGYIGAYHRR